MGLEALIALVLVVGAPAAEPPPVLAPFHPAPPPMQLPRWLEGLHPEPPVLPLPRPEAPELLPDPCYAALERCATTPCRQYVRERRRGRCDRRPPATPLIIPVR